MKTAGKNFSGFFECKIRLSHLVIVGGTVVSLATILGFLGPFSWVLDLFSHFRVQYFLSLAVAAVFLAFRQRVAVAAVFGGLALANLAMVLPLYFGGTQPSSREGAIRAVLSNVNTRSGNPAKVREFLAACDADLVALEEVSGKWVKELRDIIDRYPHKLIVPREDNFGIMVLSKLPVIHSETAYFGETDVPSLIAEIEDRRGSFILIATHPLPPAGSSYSQERNSQLDAIGGYIAERKNPVVLLGDLNTTPWNHYFRDLLRRSGLKDSLQGRGIQPTWPTFNPLLLIPLDHCLHSPEIEILDRRVGPGVGSDHFPLIVDFHLRGEKASAEKLNTVP